MAIRRRTIADLPDGVRLSRVEGVVTGAETRTDVIGSAESKQMRSINRTVLYVRTDDGQTDRLELTNFAPNWQEGHRIRALVVEKGRLQGTVRLDNLDTGTGQIQGAAASDVAGTANGVVLGMFARSLLVALAAVLFLAVTMWISDSGFAALIAAVFGLILATTAAAAAAVSLGRRKWEDIVMAAAEAKEA